MLKTNIGKKGNPFTMVLKNHGHFKNKNNFLTLILSTVYFDAAFLVSVVSIKLEEVVGSTLRAFISFMGGIEECSPHCFGSGHRYEV